MILKLFPYKTYMMFTVYVAHLRVDWNSKISSPGFPSKVVKTVKLIGKLIRHQVGFVCKKRSKAG